MSPQTSNKIAAVWMVGALVLLWSAAARTMRPGCVEALPARHCPLQAASADGAHKHAGQGACGNSEKRIGWSAPRPAGRLPYLL